MVATVQVIALHPDGRGLPGVPHRIPGGGVLRVAADLIRMLAHSPAVVTGVQRQRLFDGEELERLQVTVHTTILSQGGVMAFHGRVGRGAGRALRVIKRQEAEERNARYQLALKMATPEGDTVEKATPAQAGTEA
jgi:hypothetical protein